MKKWLREFGREAFRPGQQELVQAAVAGRNCLGIMPTGHGKSLCYQMAAAMMSGKTSVVVSPLIALMREQVAYLRGMGLAAARYDSTLEEAEREQLLKSLGLGEICLLYVAPESLENVALQQALDGVKLGVFVVDEAHCLSEWGHSFRPDYLKLPRWCEQRAFHAVMAFTATATPVVREDLCRLFSIADEDVVCISPYRKNIIRRVEYAPERFSCLLQFLQQEQNLPAIVYARTRKGTEQLAAELQAAGISAAAYHAGQPTELREQLQDDFLRNVRQVLVATIAFGMGVDKPDVRAVVHFNLPTSPESYVQESGRAGRDGAPAVSLVLLDNLDIQDARNRIFAAEPDKEGVLRCCRWLMPRTAAVVSLWEMCTTCDVPEDVPLRLMSDLQQSGTIKVASRGYKYYKVKPLFALSTILDGRDAAESSRLSWLYEHREGEVETAAEAWGCSYSETMEMLYECEQSREWKLTWRQHAVCIEAGDVEKDAREVAACLSAGYARRRCQDVERLQCLLDMFCSSICLNTNLEKYFTGGELSACGYCTMCNKGAVQVVLRLAATVAIPPESELPEFSRPAQRRRFLLGIASPGLMARRLWAHPHYGCAALAAWEEL